MDVEPAKERDGVLDTFKALRWNNSMDVESTKEENGILDTFKVLRWSTLMDQQKFDVLQKDLMSWSEPWKRRWLKSFCSR